MGMGKDNIACRAANRIARGVFAAGKLMDEKDFPDLDPAWWQAGNVRLRSPVVNDAALLELEKELRRVQLPQEFSIARV